jgi:hypothetical protein
MPVRLLAALAALTLLALAGCTRSATPEGWERYDLGTLTLARPAQLTTQVEVDAAGWPWGRQDSEGTAATMQVLAAPGLGHDRYADMALARLLAPAQVGGLPGFRLRDQTEIEVRGATSALRARFVYEPAPGRTAEGAWFVAADRDAARSVAVQVSGTKLDDELLVQLQQSLRVDGEATPASVEAAG